MKKVRFIYKIFVPNSKKHVRNADGYIEELSDSTIFELLQEEFENLRRSKSLFDDFDKAFGTIIDDCEEDRIESEDISQDIAITKEFIDREETDHVTGAQTVLQSLEYAKEKGVFWEIVNGAEVYD